MLSDKQIIHNNWYTVNHKVEWSKQANMLGTLLERNNTTKKAICQIELGNIYIYQNDLVKSQNEIIHNYFFDS